MTDTRSSSETAGLLADINKAEHAAGTNAWVRDVLKRAYQTISRTPAITGQGEAVEIGARAIARSHGHDPDSLAPRSAMCTTDNRQVPWWRVFEEQAEACIAALASSPTQIAGGADEIVTRLYRRFKDWSQRGFGPDDVTWCEVKADISAMIALSPQAQAGGDAQRCAKCGSSVLCSGCCADAERGGPAHVERVATDGHLPPSPSAAAQCVRKLDWQETFTDRGDGSRERTGWEAGSGFGSWYSVEQYFASDSYGWETKFDCEVISDHDDPDLAKKAAQDDFERRALSLSSTHSGAPSDRQFNQDLADDAALTSAEGK